MRWLRVPIAFFLVAIWLGGCTTEASGGRGGTGPSRHHSKRGSSPSSTSAEEILKNSKKKNNRIRGINAFGRLFGGGKGSNNAGEHDDECGDLPPSSSPPSGQGDFGVADEEKEVIEAVNRLLTAGDPLGAVRQLKRLQKIVKGLPISQEVRNIKLIQVGGIIGNLLCSQGRWKEAEDTLRSTLTIFGWPESTEPLAIGPPRPILNIFYLGLLENLAAAFSGQGRHVPSEALWRECIKRREALGSTFTGRVDPADSAAVGPSPNITGLGESVSGAPPTLQAIFPAQEGLSVSLANQGRFKEASILSRAALESRTRLLRGANPSDVAAVPAPVAFGLVRCRAQLATWLMALSELEEAEELLVSALEIVANRKAEFDGKISCSDLLTTLGTCLADQGRVVEAQEAHWRALQEMKSGNVLSSFSSLPIVLSSIAVGAQEISRSIADQTMGTSSMNNEDTTKSGSALLMDVLLKASLAKARTSLSHDNARLAVVLSHASHAPLYAGRLDEARELLMEALELLPNNGTLDCTLAEVLYKLGLVQCLAGREVEAEGLLRRALVIHSSSDINNAPCAASDMMALAKVLMIQGQKLGVDNGDRGRPMIEEAYSLLKVAFETHKNVFGSKSKQCAALRYIMGVAASLRGEKSISEQHFRQGLRLAKRHPRCGTVHANCELGLAGLLLGGGSADLGNPGSKPGGSGEMSGFPLPNQEEEALNLLRSAISRLGHAHPDSSAVALFAGQQLLSSGREVEAEEFLRFAAGKPVDGPDVVSSLVLLGKVLSMQEKDSEAEERARQAVSMAERIAGEDTIFAARAMLCLADVLDSIPGRWSEAQDLYKRAKEILKRDNDGDGDPPPSP